MELKNKRAEEMAEYIYKYSQPFLGQEVSEYIRGFFHGVAATLDDTPYDIRYGTKWSDDYSSHYIYYVELIKRDISGRETIKARILA